MSGFVFLISLICLPSIITIGADDPLTFRSNVAYIHVSFFQSHAGKVVLRSWYEKNKHIFPASRWEPYDPEKKWDKYTVSTLTTSRRSAGVTIV